MLVLEWMTFGDQATSRTQSVCPWRVWSRTHCPLGSSRQILTRLSQPPDTIRLAPSVEPLCWLVSSTGNAGAQLTDVHPVGCACSILRACQLPSPLIDTMLIEPSELPHANTRPNSHGAHATVFTVNFLNNN
jgi:hypothetical protein